MKRIILISAILVLSIRLAAQDNFFWSHNFTPAGGATLPTVTTNAVNPETAYWVGGAVTSDGGATVTQKGVCWNETGNPTLSDNYVAISAGVGGFQGNYGQFEFSKTYYIRAYATNSVGTAYGNQVVVTVIDKPDTRHLTYYVQTTNCGNILVNSLQTGKDLVDALRNLEFCILGSSSTYMMRIQSFEVGKSIYQAGRPDELMVLYNNTAWGVWAYNWNYDDEVLIVYFQNGIIQSITPY